MLAFDRSVRVHGADMLELDVHATKDGVLVVIHDATLERTTDGEGEVAARSWAEVERLDAGARFSPDEGRSWPFRGQGLRVPRFDELLRAWPTMRLNVEVKADAPGIETVVVELLRREGAVERVCLGSEHDAFGERLLRAAPEVCAFYPRDALTRAVMALKTGAPLPDEPYLVLDMPLDHLGMRLVDRALVEGARAAGRWVNVWTVDDPADMRQLVADGVGGIMTDRPDLLRAVLSDSVRS
ncbi:MAG: glycerophosphodiester phosphodiesterase [Deltaproteobacteria bacterium]|nr:glycerophosphodiester phosphodiesterase [Deltaproteobacteria bacterium]